MYVLHEREIGGGLTACNLYWSDGNDNVMNAPYGTCRRITRREAEKIFGWYVKVLREKQHKPIWAGGDGI